MDNTARNYGLDYMRGISCLMVILYHYTTRFTELFPSYRMIWKTQLPFGYMGVATFFLLSGFLSVNRFKDGKKIKDYILSKAKRLYPCYWIAVIVTYFITKIFLVERAVSFKSALFNLTMLESFMRVDLVDGCYWTLANELIFYTYIGVFFVLLKQKHLYHIHAFLWLIVVNIILCIDSNSVISLALNKLFMPQYAHMFLAGGFISLIFYRQDIIPRLISIIGLAICLFTQLRVYDYNYFIFFVLINITLIFFVVIEKNKIPYHRIVKIFFQPLCTIAVISYPLYLLHQNIGYAIIIGLLKLGLRDEIVILVPIVMLIVIAYILHRFIEIPFVHLKVGERGNGKNK